jgi:hypothetical protein
MNTEYVQVNGLVYRNGEVQFDGLNAHTQHAALITMLIARLNDLVGYDSQPQLAYDRIAKLEARNNKLTRALREIQWISGPTTAGRVRQIAREAVGKSG